MSQLDLVLAAGIGGYHDDWSDSHSETEGAGGEDATQPHSEDALQQLNALHAALPPAPAAEHIDLAHSVSSALTAGARINTEEVAGQPVVSVAREEVASPETQASHNFDLDVSPTVANLLADDVEFQKANSLLLKELENVRQQLAESQSMRSEKSKAYALLKVAFDRSECDRLALIREMQSKQKVVDQMANVMQMTARVLSDLVKQPFHEIPAITARLQRVLMNSIPK